MPPKSRSKRDLAESDAFPITRVMGTLKREVKKYATPVVTIYSEQKATPFMILVSTIISLRTQDKTTAEASARLFKLAKTPRTLLKLTARQLEKAIYPAGFYKMKAKTLLDVSQTLIDDYKGVVPDEVEELVKLKGVGRKTANLVVTLGYGKPGICVDTHVHRITNRWGYLETKTPDQTEFALRKILPKRYWIPINDWLVAYGQNLCKPTSPICSQCKLKPWCGQIGVTRSR